MKGGLLIPKHAPHLCVYVDGDNALRDSPIVLRNILPPDHPNHYKQVWAFDDLHIWLAQDPAMILYCAPGSSKACLVDKDSLSNSERVNARWGRLSGKIVRKFSSRFGLGVPKGSMEDGSHFQIRKNENICRFVFRHVECPVTQPDLPPPLESVKAGLVLLFGTDGTGQTGSCSTELSVMKGYSNTTITTISDQLHKQVSAAAIEKGSILASKIPSRYGAKVESVVDGCLQMLPRHNSISTLKLNFDLDRPGFVYQMCYEATLTDGTIIEYYGGHFITGEAIRILDDDSVTKHSHCERTITVEGVEAKVERSAKVHEEKMEGLFITDKAAGERKESAEESHSDGSDWEGVVVE